jgi:hypothetical protein
MVWMAILYAAAEQRTLPTEPIYRREHLRPQIDRQLLKQVIEGARHQTGYFVAHNGVNAEDMRRYHRILIVGSDWTSPLLDLVVSKRCDGGHMRSVRCSCAGL